MSNGLYPLPWPYYFRDSVGAGWVVPLLDGSTERLYFVRHEEDGLLERVDALRQRDQEKGLVRLSVLRRVRECFRRLLERPTKNLLHVFRKAHDETFSRSDPLCQATDVERSAP